MKELKVYIWHVILWEFKNTTETVKKISNIYGQGVITNHQVWNWFSKFCSGNTLLKNEPRSRCSSDLDQEALRELVECDPSLEN